MKGCNTRMTQPVSTFAAHKSTCFSLYPGIWARLSLVAVRDMRVARLDSRESDGRSASFVSVSDPRLGRYY